MKKIGLLPIELIAGTISGMEKVEISHIADYITGLEKGLAERGYDTVAMQVQLPELYRIIKQLMDATFRTKDQDLKPLLAMLELKAHQCRKCIEQRTAVRN